MQPRYLKCKRSAGATVVMMFLAALTLSGAATAADTTDRTSTVDKNSACMDRNVDASTGNCVIKDEGTPRRTYPPGRTGINNTPTPTPLPSTAPAAPSTVRKAPAAGK